MTDSEMIEIIDALQRRYSRALDNADMEAWANCFDDPGSYICTVRENEEQGLGIAMMMDDSKARIRDRVKFVNDVWKGTYEEYCTRHFIQRMEINRADDNLLRIESNFLIGYANSTGVSDLLAIGAYEDEVVITPTGARFRAKRAILDHPLTQRYLVYPV